MHLYFRIKSYEEKEDKQVMRWQEKRTGKIMSGDLVKTQLSSSAFCFFTLKNGLPLSFLGFQDLQKATHI